MNITNERGQGRTALSLMFHLSKYCMGKDGARLGTSRLFYKFDVSGVRRKQQLLFTLEVLRVPQTFLHRNKFLHRNRTTFSSVVRVGKILRAVVSPCLGPEDYGLLVHVLLRTVILFLACLQQGYLLTYESFNICLKQE